MSMLSVVTSPIMLSVVMLSAFAPSIDLTTVCAIARCYIRFIFKYKGRLDHLFGTNAYFGGAQKGLFQ